MILNLQILNEDATLNNFMILGSSRFVSGNPLKLVMRLVLECRNIRYITEVGATFSITLQKSDGTTLTKNPTVKFADDRSIIELNLTEVETQNLIGQDLKLEITEGANKHLALLSLGLQQAIAGCG
jgi:hypothetical protein